MIYLFLASVEDMSSPWRRTRVWICLAKVFGRLRLGEDGLPTDRAAKAHLRRFLAVAPSALAGFMAASVLAADPAPFQTLPPSFGQSTPAAGFHAELSAAARAGDAALTDTARRLMADRPDDAAAIAAAAMALSPAVAADVTAAAAATSGEIAIAPAAGPLAALGLGPLLAGAGGAAGVAAVAGAGGGSGGSSGAAPLPADPPTGQPPDDDDDGDPPPPVDPTPFETAEYAAQPGLAVINAATAYARSLSGDGVTVAVMDGPVDPTDPELAGAVTSNPNEILGPGIPQATYAARIIAARRDAIGIHGVAPGAAIYSSPAPGDDVAIAAAIRAAAARSHVLHNGWNTAGPPVTRFSATQVTADNPFEVDVYRRTATEDATVIVHATGDTAAGGRGDPSLRAGLPHLLPELAGVWIAVTATGGDGAITATANRCGVAAAWCLAAPAAAAEGTDVVSTARAAPHASGALALLIELFPELSASQIAARLLATADQTGIYADQLTYGQGLIDLAAATQPLGALTFVAPDAGATASLAATGITPGAAFGDSLGIGLAATPLAVADRQGALFAVNPAPLITMAPSASMLDDSFRRFAAPLTVTETDLGAGFRVSFSAPADSAPPEVAAAFTSGSTRWDVALTGERASNRADPSIDTVTGSWHAPFRSLAPRRLEITASVAPLRDQTHAADIHVTSFVGSAPDRDAAFAGTETEAIWRLGNVVVGARVGTLVERDTVLGTAASGAFAFAPDTPTTYAGASAQIGLPAGLRLNLSADMGVTFAAPGAGSIVTNMTPIRSQAFSAGISKPNIATAGDVIGIVARQPLRIESGSMSIPAYLGRAASGRADVRQQALSLVPSGRAVDVEAFYHRPVTAAGAVAASAVWRRHPGHDRTAPNEGLLSLRFRQGF